MNVGVVNCIWLTLKQNFPLQIVRSYILALSHLPISLEVPLMVGIQKKWLGVNLNLILLL